MRIKGNPKKGKVYIGTSGWVYKSWHKMFYTAKIKKDFLEFYSQHFNSVEINTSFYHLPNKSTFQKWYGETPDDFSFAVKISRYITHIRRLKGGKIPIRRFLQSGSALKEKLGIILVQLPPLLEYDKKTFKKFVDDFTAVAKKLKLKVPFALEPRHWSWFEDGNTAETVKMIKKSKMTLVFAHSAVFPSYDPEKIADDMPHQIYVRFHGPREFAASRYGKKRLKPWAERIKKWRKQGRTVYAFFNDDAHGYAIRDARDLIGLSNK